MADWPELDELKQLLDITSEDWDGDGDGTRLTRLLSAAIDYVKEVVAGTIAAYDDLYTNPTDRQSQAALRMAELLATRPTSTVAGGSAAAVKAAALDPTFVRLMFGSRRVFGVA